MASPQTQNGYTSIANEILEQIARRRFNGVQRSIIDVIWRYTYGFRRKEHQLANGFIAEAIDADLKGVKVELTRLIEWQVITVTKEGAGSRPRTLAFNKNYEQWIVGGKSEPKKITNSGGIEDSSPLEEDDSPPINKEGDAKVMAPKGKLEKSRIGKQEYAESVWLKPDEHEKLLSEFGQEGLTWMIDVLSSYKLSVDKFYASDYAVFKRGGWLRQKYEAEQAKINKPVHQSSTQRTKSVLDEEMEKEVGSVGTSAVISLMKFISSVYQNFVVDDKMKIDAWCIVLADLPPDKAMRNVIEYSKVGKFPPVPADIIGPKEQLSIYDIQALERQQEQLALEEYHEKNKVVPMPAHIREKLVRIAIKAKAGDDLP